MSLDDKVREACHRIEELYHETEGHCYVSFSGGKDSTLLLALIKLCEEVYTIPENGIPAVFCNTGVELGITYDFVRWVKQNYYPNVVIIRPEKSFDWVMKNEGKPMKSKIKAKDLHQWHYGKRSPAIEMMLTMGQSQVNRLYAKHKLADKDMHMLSEDFKIVPSHRCCEWLKKKPFKRFNKEHGMKGTMLGIRLSEGGARESSANQRVKKGGKLCTWLKEGVIQKAPIIDWTDDDVENFIKEYNVPLSRAYTEFNFERTGCMACPFAKKVDEDLEYLFYNEPNRYKASMHWLKDVYIAQNVVLPFDKAYERDRERIWREQYEPMRQEMLRKYRPNSRLLKDTEQLSLFDEASTERKEE